jgi:hypothetical protein
VCFPALGRDGASFGPSPSSTSACAPAPPSHETVTYPMATHTPVFRPDFTCSDGSGNPKTCLRVRVRRVDELSRAHLTVAASGCQQHQPIRRALLHGVRRSRLGHSSTHRRPERYGAGLNFRRRPRRPGFFAAAVAREEVTRGWRHGASGALTRALLPSSINHLMCIK